MTIMDFELLIERQSGLQKKQFNAVRWNDIDASKLQKAILFVHSTWSGASVAALRALGGFLKQYGKTVPVFVVNADEEKDGVLYQQLGKPPQGWGETFWIENGEIKHRLERYDESAKELGDYTKAIFG